MATVVRGDHRTKVRNSQISVCCNRVCSLISNSLWIGFMHMISPQSETGDMDVWKLQTAHTAYTSVAAQAD